MCNGIIQQIYIKVQLSILRFYKIVQRQWPSFQRTQRLTTSACYISKNSIEFCKIKKNQIRPKPVELQHKIRQLQISIRNVSWTSEVYLERFRWYMLCIMPLSQNLQKVIIDVLRIIKSHLCSRLCLILKRLDESCCRCNLKLLYIIPLFQNFKNLPKIFATIKPSTSLNAYVL